MLLAEINNLANKKYEGIHAADLVQVAALMAQQHPQQQQPCDAAYTQTV